MRPSLSTYWKKRDFGATPEPKGEVAHAGKALSFVIQRHAARRLHYDFRLELDGTLKSWAVPKGPSLDPHVRRMAVHVEDHPLSYATFEGAIPAGQYGAGTVIVWDRGSWVPIGDPRKGYREGKLKFELRGEKLRGRWTLVRMHGHEDERQEPWLLIKENDEEARPAAGYDVTEALPGSVNAAPVARARKAAPNKAAARRTATKGTAARKARTPSPPSEPRARRRSRSARRPSEEVMGIAVSHPDRVIYAKTGVTKLELVRYYAAIATHMIPHLKGRPIALVRAPQGIGGELFFQKHGEKIRIPGIIQLPREYWPGHPAMLEIASAETLVGAAQMNVIEFHTWNSTTRLIDKPDRFLLDMDPGEGVDWSELLEGTRLVKKMLDLLGLESFLKTSGGKGLHVVVPLAPDESWGYDEVKDFTQAIARHLAHTVPRLFVSRSGAQNRVGRIFVDYLRNGTGATTIAAFSARARPGLGVSVPVKWSELAKLERADPWNVRTVHERLARLGSEPWKGYDAVRQTPEAAWQRLREESEPQPVTRRPRAPARSARPSGR